MFSPKYTITNALLSNIKRITTLVQDLNNRRFPKLVLVEFEKAAREISTYASTSIEGNPLPLTEVKRILKSRPEHIRDSEREVLNYNKALVELNVRMQTGKLRLSLDLICDIHRHITEGLLNSHELGNFRTSPVLVNDPRSGKVVYIPPDVGKVKGLMKELVEFVQENVSVIDPHILAGLFHKQMVIIHPFIDGNGRTTRLATKVLLAQMGVNTFNLFSFEAYYNQNVTNYFQTVGEYGDYYELVEKINYTRWLEYFTAGIIDELMRVSKLIPLTSATLADRIEPHHQSILDFIIANGLITDRDYARLTDRARATRALDFRKLITLGMIERKGKGKSSYYVRKEI